MGLSYRQGLLLGYTILCHTPKQALEVAVDQRGMGRRVWIEDKTGKEVDEDSFELA